MRASAFTWNRITAAVLAMVVSGCAGGSSPVGQSGGNPALEKFTIVGSLETPFNAPLGAGSGNITFSVKGSAPDATYYWTVTGDLPSGVVMDPPEVSEVGTADSIFESISSTFRLAGLPTKCGTYPLFITVHNPAHTVVVVNATQVNLVVLGTKAECGPPTITTGSLDFIVNIDVSPPVPLTVTGGVPPFTWELSGVVGTTVPGMQGLQYAVPGIPGLRFNGATGSFYGKPTTSATQNVSVDVTDAENQVDRNHAVSVVVRNYKLEDFTGTWTGVLTNGYYQLPNDSFVDIRGQRLGLLIGSPRDITDVANNTFRGNPIHQGTLGSVVVLVPNNKEGLQLGTSSGGFAGLLSGYIDQLQWHFTCDPDPNVPGDLLCVGHHKSGIAENDGQLTLTKVPTDRLPDDEDAQAPTVRSSSPADQSVGATTFPMTVTFSEPMSNTASVVVTQGGAVASKVTFTDLTTAVINLSALNSNTPYTLTLNPTSNTGPNRFQDLAGNVLPTKTISFTTGVLSLETLSISKTGTGTGDITALVGGFLVLDCPASESSCATDLSTGTTVMLTAASNNSDFNGWGGACSGSGTCSVTLNSDMAVTAQFGLIPTYDLTVDIASPTAEPGGSVTADPVGAGDRCDVPPYDRCVWSYQRDTVVTLVAEPNEGYSFAGWSNGCTGTGACTVTMTGARTLTATFTQLQNALTVSKSGSGAGTVTSDVGGINCGTPCSATFDYGTEVNLTAAATAGSTFAGWSGGACLDPNAATCVVTMDASKTVTATFTLNTYSITVNMSGNGSGTVQCNNGAVVPCSTQFSHGSTVTLTAIPDPSSNFANWTGACTGSATTCTLTMTAAQSVTATFTLKTFALTVSKVGTGLVTSNPVGINCDTTCSATFDYGANVVLTATGQSGMFFTGWSGNCAGSADCTVTMTQARAVTATFEATATHTLTIAKNGSGTGTVTGGGINCGATCEAQVAAGTTVNLTASPDSDSVFAGWSGAGCSGTASCQVSMTAAQTVTATFNTIPMYTLTVTKGSSTGTGVVTSNPASINCGATCSAPYTSGTTVTLTATPDLGSVFAGWSGAGCSGTGLCQVSMSAAQTVTATFNSAPIYTLTINKPGTGAGTVTSDVGGINCGATCSAQFTGGTNVTLSATPQAGSVFAGWSGGSCTGTLLCNVTMTGNLSVTATFNTITYALTVNKTGTGTGVVTSNPAGIDCGATCTFSFNNGANVTLTAVPDSGSLFSGWSGGGCTGSSTCTVTMTVARSVTATFTNSSGVNQPPTANNLATRIGKAQYNGVLYNRQYAFPLTGTDPEGGPLTFRITKWPAFQDPVFSYDLFTGQYLKIVDPVTGLFSLQTSTVSSTVSTSTGTVAGMYLVFTATVCHVANWSLDTIEYVAIDDQGNESLPATITITTTNNTCNHPA